MHNQQESSSLSVVAVAVAMTVSMAVVTTMVVAVVGKAIAVGAVVSVGVSLSGGGCSGSREQAEGSNGLKRKDNLVLSSQCQFSVF